ncbi:YkvA family protein [Ketobacter alkanivorans]|uniref:DUF1232 domain-containing protein n=1 Tax=Ketobacter alkanivorans TaxID=1917421 RepID=A0A2K9LPQ2_9GAMM|nr:YkvA family protein [Ketobacter alkanivorans]AUM14237.1 hypothetical protein Kalk_18200 [Ketobacter alkanivorans]MCP5018786.1 DUF1232 domain-containing protein [Ketobacter sp.]
MAVGQSGASPELDKYSSAYSPALVLALLQKVCSRAGLDLVSRALQLYYLARSPDLPAWAKASVFAALGYFVVTPDAVPDITPVLGFVDDLAVLTSALASVSAYVSPEIRAKALERLQAWFGSDVEMPAEKFPIEKT